MTVGELIKKLSVFNSNAAVIPNIEIQLENGVYYPFVSISIESNDEDENSPCFLEATIDVTDIVSRKEIGG